VGEELRSDHRTGTHDIMGGELQEWRMQLQNGGFSM